MSEATTSDWSRAGVFTVLCSLIVWSAGCSGRPSETRGAEFEVVFRRTVSSNVVDDAVNDAILVGDSALVFVAGGSYS